MLTFSRNKLVSVYKKDDHILCARGILEDARITRRPVVRAEPRRHLRDIGGKRRQALDSTLELTPVAVLDAQLVSNCLRIDV